jgi:hypothetical protein
MESMRNGMRLFNDAARVVAESRHVPFLDFENAVPRTQAYFFDDFHLKPPGNEILARVAFEWIVRHRMVEAPAMR